MRDTETVAILGASSNPERFSNQAQHLLKQHGHRVVPVSLKEKMIDGDATVPDLAAIPVSSVDTVSVYVRPGISGSMRERFLALRPRRVIFNPGTENPELEAALREAGISTLEACTLVLLRSGEF